MEKCKKVTRMTLRQAEVALRNKISDEEFKEKNTYYVSNGELEEFKEAAERLLKARDFLEDFLKKERYALDTLRNGYIGKKVSTVDGAEFVQITRGAPYGYLAAVFDEKTKKIYGGFTYVSKDEKFVHPVIGQAIALLRAIDARKNESDIELEGNSPYLKNSDKPQWAHFKNRMYRYFRPEEFSHSRGETPMEQESFEEIHVWQFLLAAKNAKNKKEFTTACKQLTDNLKKVNTKIK
mgnify:FL=1